MWLIYSPSPLWSNNICRLCLLDLIVKLDNTDNIKRYRFLFRWTDPMGLFADGWDWICKILKIFFLKINYNILIFYITSITFYHFSNKKNHYKIKNFTFLYKIFLLFSSYQSNLLQYQFTSSNPIPSQTQPWWGVKWLFIYLWKQKQNIEVLCNLPICLNI